MKEMCEDEAIIRELERTEKIFRVRKRLESCLRKGFVELASGRFSKGFADSLVLTAATFPDDVDAYATVVVGTKKGDNNVEVLELTRNNNTEEHIQQLSKSLLSTKIDQSDISDAVTELGLRRRQGKGDSLKTESQLEQKAQGTGQSFHEWEKGMNSDSSYTYLQRWLGYIPKGKLEDSRRAFEESLDIAIELANLVSNIRSESVESSERD